MEYTVLIIFLLNLVISSPANVGRLSQYKDYNTNDSLIDLSHISTQLFGDHSKTTAEKVSKWTVNENINPEELGSYLEGDILVPITARNGLINRSFRWLNGIIPYKIVGSFSIKELEIIKTGIKSYHEKTCIRFVRRTDETDYVAIDNSYSGCWSSIGKIGGVQYVNLQTPGCLYRVGTFLHEIMHVLGFLHEQNRHDRDSYVKIIWQNIRPKAKNNFGKSPGTKTQSFGIPYDYGSVMHYSALAFSKNGKETIVGTKKGSENMGQRFGFADSDIDKINQMYQCDSGSEYSDEVIYPSIKTNTSRYFM